MLLEIVTLLIAIGYILNRFYFSGAKCLTQNRLDNKIVIITGANTGIGFNTALELAKRGARVIMACRDIARAQRAADEIKEISGNRLVEVEYLDLADLDTVRTFAAQMNEKLDRLDILVNNAGLMQIPYWKTAQGFEMQFGVNHLGHFLLTNLLVDLMKKANSARIINVSSLTHARGRIKWDDINSQKSYTPFDAYCQSKLANVLFTVELAERLRGTSITAVSLHPGIVRTEILRYSYDSYIPLGYLAIIFFPIYRILSRSPTEGCQTTLHCALDDSVPKFNGCYFNDCRPVQMAKHAQDKGDARRLWDLSAKLVNL